MKKEINQLFSSFLAIINKKIIFKFLGRILGCFPPNTKEIFILDGECNIAYLLISLFIGGSHVHANVHMWRSEGNFYS